MDLYDITEDDIWEVADYDAIVMRGLDYYKTGQILSLTLMGDRIKARVRGNFGIYDVKIAYEEGALHVSCDCPFDGVGCKHVVAVLFKWVKENTDEQRSEPAEIDLEKELSKFKKKELVSILTDLCGSNEDACRDVLLKIRKNPDASRRGTDIIRGQIAIALDTNGFIDYYSVSGVVGELERIKGTIEGLEPVQRGRLLESLAEQSLMVMDHSDDSNGELGGFIEECLKDLGRAIHDQGLPVETKKETMKKYLDLLDKEDYGLEDGYIELVLEIPSESDDFDFLIDEIKRRCEKNTRNYRRSMYSEMLMEAYKRAGMDEEYLAMLLADIEEGDQCMPLVEYWFDRGNLEKAVKIAEGCLERELGTFDTFGIFGFLEMTYESQKNWEDLLRVLVLHFKEYPSLEKYKEIQEVANTLKRWDTVRPELIEIAHGEELVKIHLFENDHEKAFGVIKEDKHRISDRTRVKVANAMVKKNPSSALEIYFPMVEKHIAEKKRTGYRIAAVYAKSIKEIYSQMGREDDWETYIKHIREVNKRRRALIDEFRKL